MRLKRLQQYTETREDSIQIDSFFASAFDSAVESTATDPFLNLIGDSELRQIADFAKGNAAVGMFFKEHFSVLFRGTKVTTVRDREILFNKLHRLRLSDAVQQDCVKLFASVSADSRMVLRFIQALLLELVSEIFKGQLRFEKEQSNVVRQQISKKDLEILHYISGFIVRRIQKKWPVEIFENAKGTKDCSEGKDSHMQWTLKKDRGGLVYPSENMFLMVQEMEVVVRQTVNSEQLSAKSLAVDPMVEQILDAHMVNVYSERLFEDSPLATRVLEDVIRMFLTVRGYAVARTERNKLAKSKKKTDMNVPGAKTSNSLRQVLKSRSNSRNVQE